MVTFRLHRKGVVLLLVGAVLVGVLLFAAGYLTALRRSRANEAVPSQAALPKASVPRLAPPVVAAPKVTAPRIAVPSAALPRAASASPAPKESQETPHISDEAFALRVGAFEDEADAKAFVEALTARGHQPVVVPVTTQSGVVLQTVLIGRYADRDEAAAAAAELKEKEELSSAVVPASRTASGG